RAGGDDRLRAANRRGGVDRSEAVFAAIARAPARDVLDDLLLRVEDRGDVHTTVLVWRAWETLDLTGPEHAHTLLRQSVRHCIKAEAGLASAKLVPKLLDQHRLLTRQAGAKVAEDHWIARLI